MKIASRIFTLDIKIQTIIPLKNNIIKDKSFSFALTFIQTYKLLIHEHNEYVLSKQLLRCGTSTGAMIREAEHAQSKLDFIHKLSIAQKECNEVLYWIDLLHQSKFLSQLNFEE